MQLSVAGRVALITGGSKGLGLAMAKAFAMAGGTVAIVARGAESLAAAEAEIKAAEAKGYVEGASDRIQGKYDSVAGAITGDKQQQVSGECLGDTIGMICFTQSRYFIIQATHSTTLGSCSRKSTSRASRIPPICSPLV